MIGAILRQLRQEQKYSLRMLSQKTGLSLGFICDIENGRCNLSIASLRKLASALGVSADIFLKDPVGDNDQNGLEITRHDPEQSK